MVDPSGLEYAPRGLIGALTPQANTTVEPEINILLPPGFGAICARLTSPRPVMNDRHLDYWATIDRALDQFANAPLSAAVFAVTGPSYLAGKDAEDALVARIGATRGYPLVTSARAVCDALVVLGARRIGLVSPYPDDLTEASIGYWRSRGFTVVDCARISGADETFHPIYTLAGSTAGEALATLRDKPVDAVVMLGTGMPTLAPIAEAAGRGGPPVLSCNLCLAWRVVEAIEGRIPGVDGLSSWIRGSGWSRRLAASTG